MGRASPHDLGERGRSPYRDRSAPPQGSYSLVCGKRDRLLDRELPTASDPTDAEVQLHLSALLDMIQE